MILLTYTNFKKEVLDCDIPFLVFFTSEDDACRKLTLQLSALELVFKDKMKMGRVNVKTFSKLAQQHYITEFPAIELFFGGQAGDEILGNVPQQFLKARLARFIESSYATMVKPF